MIKLFCSQKDNWSGSDPLTVLEIPKKDAIEHFQHLGYAIPPKTNPSDFFLDTVTIDRRSPELYESSKTRIEKFIEAFDSLPKEHFEVAKESHQLSFPKRLWSSTWVGEFLTLTDRNLLNDWRDPAVLGAAIGANLFIMFLMSILFANVQVLLRTYA